MYHVLVNTVLEMIDLSANVRGLNNGCREEPGIQRNDEGSYATSEQFELLVGRYK
jgi:hypothetical protein